MRVVTAMSSNVRVYEVTSFPSDLLRFDDIIEKLKSRFQFEAIYPQTDRHISSQPVMLGFAEGKFDGVRISELTIQNRKVVVRVLGSSDDCDVVVDAFETWVNEISRSGPPRLVTQSNESVLTSETSIPFQSLVNGSVAAAVGGSSDKFESMDRLFPTSVSFSVLYHTPSELRQHRVELSPKTITIGRANDTLDDEGLMKSRMPLRSEDHEVVLINLEQVLGDGSVPDPS
ncbi:MAG: hypothetical protein WD492_15485 [Alkalispirochaeta sp.]